MVRVLPEHDRSAAAMPGPAAMRHREQVKAANGTKPAYKVVMEETWKPKKKLLTSAYSQQKAPPGYTFVAAGDPQLTSKCKELSRREGARIYVVSTTRHQDTELSLQVHRIGWHFPSSIVDRVCTSLGVTLTTQGRILRQPEPLPTKPPKGQSRKGLGRIDKKALKNLRQGEVDREAREAIKDLFPAIPKEDLDTIISRAFELGTKKVGAMVDDLSLPRRVQLAVVAHIRHVYTDYDNLLQHLTWMNARSHVEEQTLEKLAQWRGEKEQDDPDAMEEILQEVIVISDEEDEGEASIPDDAREYQASMSGKAQTRQEIFQIRSSPVDYGRQSMANRRSVSPEAAEMQTVRHLGGGQYIVSPKDRSWAERARNHQEHVWREARRRVYEHPPQQISRGPFLPQFDGPGHSLRPTDRGTHLVRYEPNQRPAAFVEHRPQVAAFEQARQPYVALLNHRPNPAPQFQQYQERVRQREDHAHVPLRLDHDRAALKAPIRGKEARPHVPEPLSPADLIIPSIEPVTPKRDRRFEEEADGRWNSQIVYLSPADRGPEALGPFERRNPDPDHDTKRMKYYREPEGREFATSMTAASPHSRTPSWHTLPGNDRGGDKAFPAYGVPHPPPLQIHKTISGQMAQVPEPALYRQPATELSSPTQPDGRFGYERRAPPPHFIQNVEERRPEWRPADYQQPASGAPPLIAAGHAPPESAWVSRSLVRGRDGRLYERRVTHQAGPFVTPR